VGTVVGFPHGNETPAMKEYQANQVVDLGAQEIDLVMNIPALKNVEQQLLHERYRRCSQSSPR
jgi:deoxyribose-phosphate aldolase